MNENTKFKVLMYGNIYVDMNLLDTGIYETNRPTLYFENTTIETIISGIKEVEMFTEIKWSDTYFENLKKCKLVPITITFDETVEEKESDIVIIDKSNEDTLSKNYEPTIKHFKDY